MTNHDIRAFHLAAAILALAAAGCSNAASEPDPLPRVAVSGTVKLDGTALPQGQVQFEPVAAGSGIIALGEITDGRFSIDPANGPVPGKYRVMVSSRPVYKVKPGEDPGSPPKPPAEMIPSRYSGRSSELEVEVKNTGVNNFEFDLKKKP